jgi:hypothetical protein
MLSSTPFRSSKRRGPICDPSNSPHGPVTLFSGRRLHNVVGATANGFGQANRSKSPEVLQHRITTGKPAAMQVLYANSSSNLISKYSRRLVLSG